jgi:hypothetical protein
MLICIDFQPAYAESFSDLMIPLRSRLRSASRNGELVHFIYNEATSLEGEVLGDSIDLVTEWCARERLPIDGARMLRKNFGWVSHLFRESVERKIAINILRLLMKQGLSASNGIPGCELERIVASAHGDFPGFWDCSPEAWEEIMTGAIAMPYVFDGGVTAWLESLHGQHVEVIGGFRHRCLDEMCMMLEAGGISHHLNETLIYSVPEEEQDISGNPLLADSEEREPMLFSESDLLVA